MAKRRRKHKPLKLLKSFHSKMGRNLIKLENIIKARQAKGER